MSYEYQNDKSNSIFSITPLSSVKVLRKNLNGQIKNINNKTVVLRKSRNWDIIMQLNNMIFSQITRSKIFLFFALYKKGKDFCPNWPSNVKYFIDVYSRIKKKRMENLSTI